MENLFMTPFDLCSSAALFFKNISHAAPRITEATFNQAKANQTYWTGLLKYVNDFAAPSFNAFNAFANSEEKKLPATSPEDNLKDYTDLMALNMDLAAKAFNGGLLAMNRYCYQKAQQNFSAWVDTICGREDGDIAGFMDREEDVMDTLVHHYPKAIRDIKSEYGFHFDDGGYIKTFETERFELYQVLPRDRSVRVREDGKPIIIIPPYVLGANILAFMPAENRSYVHCFSNQGIPTYVRVVKDIGATPAVQVMSGEDDALDIRFFAEQLVEKHGNRVTLNGFCQGGYHAVVAVLSGELDGLVDALITCATPMDGTRSKSLTKYMMSLPPRFRDMSYSLKTLPNGNKVVDGKILGWVYKLRKMEAESPVAAFHRDLSLFDSQRGPTIRINKTAAAINHWIVFDQQDIPVEITKMSFDAYSIPVAEDGTLPVRLFGRKLNFRHLKETRIPWLLCIADNDDLVDREASLAPLDFVDAEVTVFPKGHASIATSWSIPTSECALHLRFCSPSATKLGVTGQLFRGPVCFHLDLEKALHAAVAEAVPETVPEIAPEGFAETVSGWNEEGMRTEGEIEPAVPSPSTASRRRRKSKDLKVVK
jgi:hypothetical protein